MLKRLVVIALLMSAAAMAPVLALGELSAPAGVTISAPVAPSLPGGAEFAPGLLLFGMAIRVKDPATVARKWTTRAAAASGDYAAGVKEAGGDWEANTIAGAGNFAAGVQQAITDGRYERGVREAGSQRYVSRASTIGANRFAPGVQASEAEMQRGIAPVLQTIAGITLPPRRPKGDPGNMERANVVAQTLRKMKTGR